MPEKQSHVTEERFPLQTNKFREIVNEMYQMHLDKNKDYSPANIVIAGEVGLIVRMWDKMSRIFNLMGLSFPSMSKEIYKVHENIQNTVEYIYENFGNDPKILKQKIHEMIDVEFADLVKKTSIDYKQYSEKTPANEPLEDAFKDLAVYAIIGMIYRSGSWGR